MKGSVVKLPSFAITSAIVIGGVLFVGVIATAVIVSSGTTAPHTAAPVIAAPTVSGQGDPTPTPTPLPSTSTAPTTPVTPPVTVDAGGSSSGANPDPSPPLVQPPPLPPPQLDPMIPPYFIDVWGSSSSPSCANYERLDDTYFQIGASAVDDEEVASVSAWVYNVGGNQTVPMWFDGTYWHGSYIAPPGEGNLSYADITVVDNFGLGTTEEIIIVVNCS